jgi:hypothetical protein
MSEQERYRDEDERISAGATPRDPEALAEECSRWRETTDRCVLEALDMYGTYLIGQGTGMDCSGPLSLPAVDFVLRMESVPADEQRDVTQRLQLVHATYMAVMRSRKRRPGHG